MTVTDLAAHQTWVSHIVARIEAARVAMPPWGTSLYVRLGRADHHRLSEAAQPDDAMGPCVALGAAMVVIDDTLSPGRMEVCYSLDIGTPDTTGPQQVWCIVPYAANLAQLVEPTVVERVLREEATNELTSLCRAQHGGAERAVPRNIRERWRGTRAEAVMAWVKGDIWAHKVVMHPHPDPYWVYVVFSADAVPLP